MIDALARTYHKLPSEVLRTADTFDLMVLDVSNTHMVIEDCKKNNKPLPPELTKMSQEDMVKRMEEARNGSFYSR